MATPAATAPGATTDAPVHARATVRPDKAEVVAELTASFRDSSAAVLTEYRGLTVKQITDLRRALGEGTTYAIVKNTLTKIAAGEAGLDSLDALLEGPTAVAFVGGEPVTAAKALRDYARANPLLVIKGGVLDGKAVTADEIRQLADLESREVLLARLAGALLASLSQAVYLFNAPLAQVARLAGALEAKATEDPSVLAGGAGTPDSAGAPSAQDDAAAQDDTAAPAAALAEQAGVDEAGTVDAGTVDTGDAGTADTGDADTSDAGTVDADTGDADTGDAAATTSVDAG